jgi:hypothetical protein
MRSPRRSRFVAPFVVTVVGLAGCAESRVTWNPPEPPNPNPEPPPKIPSHIEKKPDGTCVEVDDIGHCPPGFTCPAPSHAVPCPPDK